MANLKITDLVGKDEIEKIKELDGQLLVLLGTYEKVAKELADGIRMKVETPKDLEKLYEIYSKQLVTAKQVSGDFNVTLEKQKMVLQEVADNLQKQVTAGELSTKEMKVLSEAGAKNAVALEKVAKAETAVSKARNAANTSRRNTKLTEEERLKVIREAITLSNKEVHSIQEANEAISKMRQAVKLLKDTDEDYVVTLARLNSTIGVHTDYVKRNSDRYTKQKMTIGSYREEIKAALIELNNGNNSLKNMGIVAKGFGNIMKTSVVGGLNEVRLGVGGMIKGFIGAQAILNGIQRFVGLLKSGVRSIIGFEAANSKLSAILGTTSDNLKDLECDAKRLGATTKYTAAEATNLQIELAKLGFSKKEIKDSTEYVLRFAQATGAELSEAAALAGASLRMFNADTAETERYVSAMAVATTKSALSFSYLQTAMSIVGPVAKAFNFTIEDTLALLGKLADAGFDASSAATATRNILLNLADSGGKLAKSLGRPVKTLPELVAGLQKLKEQGVDLNTTLDLTDKRSVSAFNAFLTAADKIVPLREQITGVDKELADMAHRMGDNVEGALAGLSSAWESFMLSFYKSKGVMKEVIDFLAQGLRNIANDLRPLEERENDTIQEAIRNRAELRKQSEADKRLLEDIQSLSDKYEAGGMNASDALKKASEEHIITLEEERKQITKLTEEHKRMYKGRTETIISAGFWEKNLNASKFKQYKKERDTYFNGWKQGEVELSVIADKIRLINQNLQKGFDAQATSVTSSHLTDKQKKELEKQAKERRKILETMQQSELDLMDEGLEKELAQIAFSYNKRIAAISGNSKEEQRTRENLAMKMQKELGDYEVDYYLNKEKQVLSDKLSITKKGSEEEYHLKLSLLNVQEEMDKESAIRRNEDIAVIEEKYRKKRMEAASEYASVRNKQLEDEYSVRTVLMNTEMGKQLDEATVMYKKGEIDAEEYEKQKTDIQKKYMLQQLRMSVELVKAMSDMPGLSDEDKLKIKQKVADAEMALANAVRDAEVDAIKDVEKERRKWQDGFKDGLTDMSNAARDVLGDTADIFKGLSDVIEDVVEDGKVRFETLVSAVSTMFSGITSIIQNSFNARIEKIEEEQDANEEAQEKEVERIEQLAETGAITEEEAEARKRAAQDKTAAKNALLDKKKQDLARKQAEWDKANSIVQAGIATALAITKALPNFVLAAIVGAMGAAQIAMIAASPIPSYAEGTKDGFHPGGKALVGDAGKHEVVMYKGQAWITPNTPVIVDLPRGAKVFPDFEDVEFPNLIPFGAEQHFMPHILPDMVRDGSKTTIINDYSRLERKMDENNKLLALSIRQRRKESIEREFEIYKLKRL